MANRIKKVMKPILDEAYKRGYEQGVLEGYHKKILAYENESVYLKSILKAQHELLPEWIPASEPPKEWKDENGDAINYLIYSPGIGIDIGNWIEPAKCWFCLGVPFKVTHWMSLPEPPKEDA